MTVCIPFILIIVTTVPIVPITSLYVIFFIADAITPVLIVSTHFGASRLSLAHLFKL